MGKQMAVMNIINRKNIKPFKDACGKLQELYTSDKLSVSYSIITHASQPHKHNKMEEVYFILKGKAKLKVGKKLYPIKAGDVFLIPKKEYHHIEDVKEKIELVVVTHPKFDKKDVLLK
jgi:mannose-6-phosphate isomerase-like protein (cupin superfamily)